MCGGVRRYVSMTAIERARSRLQTQQHTRVSLSLAEFEARRTSFGDRRSPIAVPLNSTRRTQCTVRRD